MVSIKVIEISDVNEFDEGTDYLVQLSLSKDEKQQIENSDERWKGCIDSAVAHAWVENGIVTGIDISVFDGAGGWEDGINAEDTLSAEDIGTIREYVQAAMRKEEQGVTLIRLEEGEALLAGGYEELSIFFLNENGNEELIESDFELRTHLENSTPLYMDRLHHDLLRFMKANAPLPFTGEEITFLYQAVLSSAITEKADLSMQDKIIFKLEFLLENFGHSLDTQPEQEAEYEEPER